MELSVFEEVAELVRAMTPPDLGDAKIRAHRRGVKLWFGVEATAKEHYEAQMLSRRYVDGSDGMAVEIGFHAEHKDLQHNVAAVEQIDAKKAWRKELGGEPEVGVFFGADNWRRVSEAWIEPDLDDPEAAFEIASRLVDYVTAIEKVRN